MILIDGRAGSVDLIPLLPPDITKKVTLEGGDAAFFGYGPEGPYTFPIGLEYKTVNDALDCMHDGRLVSEQLPKMSEQYKRVYLLIEGQYKASPEDELLVGRWKASQFTWSSFSKTTYTQFDNWLNSLVEIGRVTVKRSIDRPESAQQVHNLYKFWCKDYESHSSLLKFNKDREPYKFKQPNSKEIIARQLPGVGHDLAAKASEVFTTPLDLANATEEQWQQIHGIGKRKAKTIYQFWRT